MLDVLLVDDENWVLESLNAAIEWKEYGFRVAGMATNGLEAFRLIQELKPDLVITDIRMPGMNGLELIKKTKEILPKVQFIVASGYAEFAYAQKAMSYGAVGYTLKPFDEAEIISLLKKAGQSARPERPAAETELAYLLENMDSEDDRAIRELLDACQLNIARDKPLLFASCGKGKLRFPDGAKCLSIRAGSMKWAYLVKSDLQELDAYLENQLDEQIKGIAAGKRICSINELPEAMEEVIPYTYGFFMTGSRQLCKSHPAGYTGIKAALSQLEGALKNKDLQRIDAGFGELEALLTGGGYTIKHAYYIYNVSMSFLYNQVEPDETAIDHYEMLLKMFDGAGQMLRHIKSIMRGYISANTNTVAANLTNKTVNSILQYVNENFYKGISIQSISQKFYVNPNYISQLFKKAVGSNFIEYLVKLRIDYACRLLKESDYAIQTISEKVGYNDYFYFTRAFKKMTGKTPSEYRNEP
jgi:two-component system response regulator YesN